MIALWLIPIVISYMIVMYLVATGIKEVQRQEGLSITNKDIIEILDYKITDISNQAENSQLIKPFGKEIKLSKELLKSYLSKQVGR